MSYQVEFTLKEKYLYVVVRGNSSYDNAMELWNSIAEECKKINCFNVLGEQILNNPMPTLDAWNHQTIFSEAGITAKYLIAWVDKNPKTFQQTDFIRTVLSNRDIGYGKLFSDAEKAESWLLEKIANRT